MDNSFALIPMIASNKLAVNKIIELNEITLRYGLMLSPGEALELVATRTHALNANGRIELAGGIINKVHFLYHRDLSEKFSKAGDERKRPSGKTSAGGV